MSILISGCSSGIGLETALFLQEKGFDVIATARNEAAIYFLEKEGLKAINLDVNSSNSISSAVATAITLSDNGKIDVLINNAGYGQVGALEDLSRDALREQFETNVFGLIELTNAVLPYMREQNEGLVINISSVLGLVTLPFRGAYSASKYAVEAISDTYRMELASTPIHFCLIEPGPIVSRFRQTCVEKATEELDIENSLFKNTYKKMIQDASKTKPFALTGKDVAKKIFKIIGTKSPKPRYKITIPTYIVSFLKRILSSTQLEKRLIKFGR